MSIGQGCHRLQFERAALVNDQIEVQFLAKSSMGQTDFHFFNRSIFQDSLQSGSIDRFMEISSQAAMNFERMVQNFVCDFAELCLRMEAKWNLC